MVCGIDPHGPIPCQAKLQQPRVPPLRCCDDSATRASRSPSRSGVSAATVSRILRRLGLNRLAALEPAEPIRRYEREHAGELILKGVKHQILMEATELVASHVLPFLDD